ncbi:MAG: Ig-like domain-containing protein [Calditrichia bacterium]
MFKHHQRMRKTAYSFSLLFILFFLQCSLPTNIDDFPPQVTIIHPTTNQAVSGEVIIAVGASDNEDLKTVRLYIDGVSVATTNKSTLEYIWDTSEIADNRNHSIHATATDDADNMGFSGPTVVRVVSGALADTLPPVINIVNPVSGSSVRDTVHVFTQVNDDGSVDRVEFYVDGVLKFTDSEDPYNFDWDVTGFANGTSHTVFARAYDGNNNSASSNVVSVTVQKEDITPPTLIILYPPGGSTYQAGDTVIVTVDAQDNAGIDRVDFYVDGNFQFSDHSAPYKFEWDTAGYGSGRQHSIFIKAYDIFGNTTSQILNLQVNP